MKSRSFLSSFMTLVILAAIVVAVATPILHSQIREALFNLNLDKNREQAERLATLASIDLEQGADPDRVLNKLQHMLENTPQSSEHFACIIEDENLVIAHPKRSNINKDVTGWTIESAVEVKTFTQSAGEGIAFGGIQTRLDGSQDISYQVPISTKPWSVCVHTKLDLVEQQARQILYQVGWVTLPGVLFLSLVGALVLSRGKDELTDG